MLLISTRMVARWSRSVRARALRASLCSGFALGEPSLRLTCAASPVMRNTLPIALQATKRTKGTNEMKAVRVKGFGGVDQLELVELPDPQPQAGQVCIRVEACGVNYADVMQREGLYPGGPKPPYIPGLEAAGVVEESNDSLPVGSRVLALSAGGFDAESDFLYS